MYGSRKSNLMFYKAHCTKTDNECVEISIKTTAFKSPTRPYPLRHPTLGACGPSNPFALLGAFAPQTP